MQAAKVICTLAVGDSNAVNPLYFEETIMIFHQTNCNYVGVPEGWVELEAGDSSILRLKSMKQCKIKRYYRDPFDVMDDTKPQKIDPKDDWYKVRAGDCSLYVALISGDVQTLDGGNTINCRQLSDQYFNGTSTPNAFPVVDFPILV